MYYFKIKTKKQKHFFLKAGRPASDEYVERMLESNNTQIFTQEVRQFNLK